MKSIIKTGNLSPEYPRLLMQSTSAGCVVLFSDHGCGVVINGKSLGGRSIGHYSMGWDMYKFEPFTGTVELSNN